jgi:hypothetical protein
MSPLQRKTYFGSLWPSACAAQGWDSKDEDRRRDVTMEATGKDSTSRLTQAQITLLFNHLKQLANPADFDLAYITANPEIALEEHKRGQIIWRIENETAKAGLKEEWLEEISDPKCAEHSVKHWRQLPTIELLKLSMTVETRTSAEVKARRASKRPAAQPVQETCTDDTLPAAKMPF